MIEQRWLEKEGKLHDYIQKKVDAGIQTTISAHSFVPPDKTGLWFPHPNKPGWYVKLQYRYQVVPASRYGSTWSTWKNVGG